MFPNPGAIYVFGFFALIGYLFWRGTVVVMRARRLVRTGALFVDAGTPAEFLATHIAGSVNIPAAELAQRQGEIGARDREVVVYARSAYRSAQAAQVLRSIGYHSVTNVGPMKRWGIDGEPQWTGDALPAYLEGDAVPASPPTPP
jgi:rhodanese-related sulfurtransferase